MKYATGKYLMFLDSDDFLTNNILEKIYCKAEEYNVDVMPYNIQMFLDEDFGIEIDLEQRIRKQDYNETRGIDLLTSFLENGEMTCVAWGALYRREYLLEEKIDFISGILHEDMPFTFKALINAKNVIFSKEIVYNYRQRKYSILHSPNHEKLLEGLVVGYNYVFMEWYQYKQSNGTTQRQDVAIRKFLNIFVYMMGERYLNLMAENKEISNEVIRSFINNIALFAEENLEKYFEDIDIKRIRNAKNIYIYGAGNMARRIIFVLSKNNIEVSGIYVSSLEGNPDVLYGIKVKEFDSNLIGEEECIVVAISSLNQNEVVGNLEKNSVENYVRTIAI